LIAAVLDGEVLTDQTIIGLIDSSMLGKSALLADAMDGVMSGTQKMLIKAVLDHIDDMARRIAALNDIIEGEMEKYDKAVKRLDRMDGIGVSSAQAILAEIGLSMDRFPTAGHLAVWAGVCPGSNESAGKKRRSPTRKGNMTLRATLVQCAQAAVKKKGTFFRAQYERLVVRRGKNRAKMAVAHSMIIAIWHMLKYDTEFKDLGGDFYNRFNPERKIAMHLKKLKELGWEPPITETA
jgi:transposase